MKNFVNFYIDQYAVNLQFQKKLILNNLLTKCCLMTVVDKKCLDESINVPLCLNLGKSIIVVPFM